MTPETAEARVEVGPLQALPEPSPKVVLSHPQVIAAHRATSLGMLGLGLAGVVLAPVHALVFGLTGWDVVLFVTMYWATLGPGLSVGYHRHFSHGAFQARPWVRVLLGVLGSMGGQGPLFYWVAIHRRHHERSDEPGDPHSPHVAGGGAGGLLRGLWHAHFGWTLAYAAPSTAHYCPDLVRTPCLAFVNRHYGKWMVAGLLLPTAVGFVAGGWPGALGGFVYGGALRVFLTSNITWSLNSVCHRFGGRPFAVRDHSGNVGWLALPTLGESWHNNHHARPTAAAHGIGWRQVDLNYAFIRLLELLGLATKVSRPDRPSHPARV